MKYRLVDRILSWERDHRICGRKNVSFEEYGLKGALGERERLPESLLLESLLQLGNWLLILSSDFSEMGLVTELEPVTYQTPLRPGQSLTMEVVLRQKDDRTAILAGSGHTGHEAVLSASGWRIERCPLEAYHNPQDLRVLFGEIYRPVPGAST